MEENGAPSSRRLDQIDATLIEVKSRLDRIEVRLGLVPAPAAPVPPPIMRAEDRGARAEAPFLLPPLQEPEERRTRIGGTRPTAQPLKPPPAFDISTPPGEDAELKFGSVVLPRVGAGVMLLGIGYLVALGIKDGWITPVMQFWGAIVLCLSSIGIGLWKRQEKFDFGQVLVGLGSCGLYVTFACGHVFQNLYSGNVLVVQFLVLSLVNLFYGAMTPSKTFTAIGLVGGMIAATLPMKEGNVGVSLWLHAAIVLPTAAIIAKHKWREMAIGAWAVSTAALLWPVLAQGPFAAQLVVLYGASFSLLLAYAWSHESWEFDPQAAYVPFAAMLTGLIALVASHRVDPGATYHLVFFGMAMAASALLMKSKESRKALLLAGVLAPFTLAPQGLLPMNAAWTYLGLGFIAAAASLKAVPKASTVLAGLGFGLSIVMYLQRLNVNLAPLGVPEESFYLLGVVALTSFGAWAIFRWFKDAQLLVLISAIVISPIVTRLAVILMGVSSIGASVPVSIATAMLGLSAASATLGIVKKWGQLSGFGWTAFAAAVLSYLYALGEVGLSVPVEAEILAGMLAVIVLNTICTGKSTTGREAQSLVLLGGILISPFLGRLFVILMGYPSIGASTQLAVTIAMLGLSAAAAILAIRKHWPLIAGYSWGALAVSVSSYLFAFGDPRMAVRVEVPLLLSMLAVIVLSTVATARTANGRDPQPYVLASSILISPFVSRLAAVLMADSSNEASASFAVAAAMLSLSATGAILSMRRGWVLMAGFSWAGFFASGIAYLVALADRGLTISLEVPILVAMLAVILLSGAAAGKTSGSKDAACVLAGFTGWGVFSRLVFVIGSQPGGLSGTAAITLAWILYAIALIVAGFVLDLRPLRLTSLSIFGMTLGKVMVYDLAGLDQGVRVVLLILLGGAMIAGGYWYIRRMGPTGKPPAVVA